MIAAGTDIVVAFVNILLVPLSVDQVRRVALAFGEYLDVVNLHMVFVFLQRSPRVNVAAAPVDVGRLDAWDVTVVNFVLKHQQCLGDNKSIKKEGEELGGLTILSCKVSIVLKKFG